MQDSNKQGKSKKWKNVQLRQDKNTKKLSVPAQACA